MKLQLQVFLSFLWLISCATVAHAMQKSPSTRLLEQAVVQGDVELITRLIKKKLLLILIGFYEAPYKHHITPIRSRM